MFKNLVAQVGRQFVILGSLLVCCHAKAQASQEPALTPTIESVSPVDVPRGTDVTVIGKGFPSGDKAVIAEFGGISAPGRLLRPDGTMFTFRVPPDQTLGHQTLRLRFTLSDERVVVLTPQTSATSREINVVDSVGMPVKLSSIYPLTTYPASGSYSFRLLGEGFSVRGEDHRLVCEGRGEIPIVWQKDGRTTESNDDHVFGRVVNEHELEIWGRGLSRYQGPIRLQVRVGDAGSSFVGTTLVGIGRWWIILLALGIVLVLFGLVYAAATRGLKEHSIDGQTYGPFTQFFLDKETDTYSLSKLQLILWLVASVFAYIYLLLAWLCVQFKGQLPDVPTNIPSLFFVSAATTAVARVITNTRGPKGAGDIHPSVADFITTGGVVAAERVQFFVWTIVGIGAFLYLLVSRDPASIQEVPIIPQGFLAVMGVSAAGYLGGKLARTPGPIIDAIVAKKGSKTIEVQGRNLSGQATILMDGKEVTAQFVDETAAPNAPKKDVKLQILKKEDQTATTTFAKVLAMEVVNDTLAASLASGEHTLTVINPDGQKATWTFAFSA